MKRLALILVLVLFLSGCRTPVSVHPVPVHPVPGPTELDRKQTEDWEEAFTDGPEIVLNGTLVHSFSRDGRNFVTVQDLERSFADCSWKSDRNTYSIILNLNGEETVIPKALWPDDGEWAQTFQDDKRILVALDALQGMNSINVLEDGDTVYVSEGLDRDRIPQGITVPVLMYHCISDDVWGSEPMFTSPAAFREQMEYLLDHGYDPIWFSDLARVRDFDKPVIITLDDGYDDNYTEMFPIIRELGIHVTIYAITKYIDADKHMTAQQMREMSDSGLVEFGSHTYEHMHLPDNSAEEQRQTMERSRLEITRATGKIPYTISYPTGRANEDTYEAAALYYDAGIRTGNKMYVTDGAYFNICRLSMYRDTPLSEYADILKGRAVGSVKE